MYPTQIFQKLQRLLDILLIRMAGPTLAIDVTYGAWVRYLAGFNLRRQKRCGDLLMSGNRVIDAAGVRCQVIGPSGRLVAARSDTGEASSSCATLSPM